MQPRAAPSFLGLRPAKKHHVLQHHDPILNVEMGESLSTGSMWGNVDFDIFVYVDRDFDISMIDLMIGAHVGAEPLFPTIA